MFSNGEDFLPAAVFRAAYARMIQAPAAVNTAHAAKDLRFWSGVLRFGSFCESGFSCVSVYLFRPEEVRADTVSREKYDSAAGVSVRTSFFVSSDVVSVRALFFPSAAAFCAPSLLSAAAA